MALWWPRQPQPSTNSELIHADIPERTISAGTAEIQRDIIAERGLARKS